MYRNKLLFLFLLILPGFHLFSQDAKLLTNNGFWLLSDSSYLFQKDTVKEIWIKDKTLDIWKLNASTEIYTFCNSQLRVWRKGNENSLWKFDKKINDWKNTGNIQSTKEIMQDSIVYSNINDTIKLVEINGKKMVFKTYSKIYLWNRNHASKSNLINDTISLYPIDDTTQLWINKGKSIIWNLNTTPKTWKVSKSTIVWTIDGITEFWKAGANYNLWTRTNTKDKWEQNASIQSKLLDSTFRYWTVNQNIIIFSNPDTVQIWQARPKEKIWYLGDSLRIWKLKPPKIIVVKKDTVIPERKVKTAQLWNEGKSVQLWTVNDSIKLFKSDYTIELWRLNNSVKLWKISDSSLIWNINNGTKVSMISDTILVWIKKKDKFEWDKDSLRKPILVNKDLLLLEINDSCRLTKIKDTTSIWNSFGSVRMTGKKNLENYYTLRDTIEYWQANDSTKIKIGKFDEKGQVWERNKKVNILNINDSTKIWQLNEQVRLSIIDGKMKIWRQGIDDPNISWRETKEFKRDKINDSTKIWYINENTIIWESRQKIEVWNLNKNHEIFRLSDTSVVYTYSTAQVPPKLPVPKYWSYLGTGKMDIAQVWIDQWAKGGENSITTLFILNFQANYARKKVKWNNDFEYRYGFIRPGDKPLRKNEDKIKINSILNYYAFNKFYYGFTVTGLSQFFKGYQYINDSTRKVVSDYLSPLYFTAALGLNYLPIKQLSVFFSPLTDKIIYVNDTVSVNQTTYGVPVGKKMKTEPGLIIKSVLNWNINKNINVLSKLDLFTRYTDLKKYNVDWENTLTFKFTNLLQATLNTHLIYDPDVLIKQSDGSSKQSVQFKEVFSIGFFYKI